jgi:hypothetical protein
LFSEIKQHANEHPEDRWKLENLLEDMKRRGMVYPGQERKRHRVPEETEENGVNTQEREGG